MKLPFDPVEIETVRKENYGALRWALFGMISILVLMGLAIIHLNVERYLDAQMAPLEKVYQ